ncbi:MAG: aminotransferase class I/II-fold pyridoxal phosphate-dependent enzyme [Oscillospiraceae bacterium]|nr:aminotransferase class I/II-fold pyridoxal phosphate-dependent enzyme [Oscillospiraceae bacterium]
MQYDFTSIMDRHGWDAMAVDGIGDPQGFAPGKPREGFDSIPMWVADMNFPTAPTITEAIIRRAEHPAFGYFQPRKEYFDAIINWHRTRNGVEHMSAEDIGYENGVLGCLVSALNAFTLPGEPVLLHSPTYIGFTHSITDAGREIVLSDLVQDEQGVWRMDYADMEQKIRAHHIHMAVFCSPHNPCGRVWERWEIEKAMEVYAANDVIVVSDEIWSDILLDGHRHIPTQSVSDEARNRTIAIYAPSKTFNLAGLIGSYHVVYNPYLRDRLNSAGQRTYYNSMNVLSMHALIGAYSPEGMDWVDQLCAVLSENVNAAYEFFTTKVQGVSLAKPEGTYMLYLDCQAWCQAHGKTQEELLHAGWDVGVTWQDGKPFHRPYAIRMNLAVPHSRVLEALNRLEKYVF